MNLKIKARKLKLRLRTWWALKTSNQKIAMVMIVVILLFAVNTVYTRLEFTRVTNDIRESGRAAFAAVEESRITQTREGCAERNADRRIQRKDIRQGIRDLQKVSEEAVDALNLGITKEQAIQRARQDLNQIPIINCEAEAQEVRRTSPDFQPLP
jgi:hypothetical protein